MESFELEESNTAGSGGTSWTLRVPWLRNKRNRKQRQDDENSSIQTELTRSMTKNAIQTELEDQDSVYYGGIMKTTSPTFVSMEAGKIEALEGDGLYRPTNTDAETSSELQQQSHTPKETKGKQNKERAPRASPKLGQNLLPRHNTLPINPVTGTNNLRYFISDAPHLEPKNNNKVFRNRSWISTSSRESGGRNDTEDDSLADFDEAEWTPQDSAYGAAIPVCGWVPKRLRQGIEATLIGITVFALVYLVVTTSISISESKADGTHLSYNDTGSGVKAYDSGLEFDDDWYVEYSQYTNDEDDYFGSNYDYRNYGGGRNNGNYRNQGG